MGKKVKIENLPKSQKSENHQNAKTQKVTKSENAKDDKKSVKN